MLMDKRTGSEFLQTQIKSFQPKTVTLGKGIHPIAAPEGSVRIDKKAISEDVEVLFTISTITSKT